MFSYIPGPCKGEPGLYFAISPSTEMTPALCGPAADDQMLRSPTNPMCHVAAAKVTLVTGHPSASTFHSRGILNWVNRAE